MSALVCIIVAGLLLFAACLDYDALVASCGNSSALQPMATLADSCALLSYARWPPKYVGVLFIIAFVMVVLSAVLLLTVFRDLRVMWRMHAFLRRLNVRADCISWSGLVRRLDGAILRPPRRARSDAVGTASPTGEQHASDSFDAAAAALRTRFHLLFLSHSLWGRRGQPVVQEVGAGGPGHSGSLAESLSGGRGSGTATSPSLAGNEGTVYNNTTSGLDSRDAASGQSLSQPVTINVVRAQSVACTGCALSVVRGSTDSGLPFATAALPLQSGRHRRSGSASELPPRSPHWQALPSPSMRASGSISSDGRSSPAGSLQEAPPLSLGSPVMKVGIAETMSRSGEHLRVRVEPSGGTQRTARGPGFASGGFMSGLGIGAWISTTATTASSANTPAGVLEPDGSWTPPRGGSF